MGVHRISGFSEDFLFAPHDFSLECLKIKVRHKDRPLCGGHHPKLPLFFTSPLKKAAYLFQRKIEGHGGEHTIIILLCTAIGSAPINS